MALSIGRRNIRRPIAGGIDANDGDFAAVREGLSELDRTDLDTLLDETAARLEAMLAELCGRLRPFPAFMGMATIQAVELEPTLGPKIDRGCVVVTPDGMIAELDVTAIPGVVGVLEVDQVEEFKPLEELSPEEYLVYLVTAVRTLSEEARRRGV